MQLSLQTFTSLVQGMAASVQAATTQLLDLTVGSILRAILEANASIALWMQWLILQVLQMTRAATSNGADLDSWMADFSLTRMAASPASGMVTFSRFNSSAAVVVPVGSLVRTADGAETFAVTEDTTLAGWSQSQNGYVVGTGNTAIDVPVVALVAGASGNVQAASISVLASALSGLDSVINASAFTNGIDVESDVALRLRFQSFMASLSRATVLAVKYAISSVQQGLNYTIQENINASGISQVGCFIIVVDDGSGYPSNALLSTVQQAVDAVRPVGSIFAVFAPAVTLVNISVTVTVVAGYDKALAVPQITTAIDSFVNALPVGASLPLSRIAQIAYSANPNVINVTTILLNGQASDISVPLSAVVKAGTVVVS